MLFRIIIISPLFRIELMKKIPVWYNIYPNLYIIIYILYINIVQSSEWLALLKGSPGTPAPTIFPLRYNFPEIVPRGWRGQIQTVKTATYSRTRDLRFSASWDAPETPRTSRHYYGILFVIFYYRERKTQKIYGTRT